VPIDTRSSSIAATDECSGFQFDVHFIAVELNLYQMKTQRGARGSCTANQWLGSEYAGPINQHEWAFNIQRSTATSWIPFIFCISGFNGPSTTLRYFPNATGSLTLRQADVMYHASVIHHTDYQDLLRY
jgi:hypothetical protein